MSAPTLIGIDTSGSTSLTLACACGRNGPPVRGQVLHYGAHPVERLWREGLLRCPCGAHGDRLSVVASPAGSPPRVVDAYRWGVWSVQAFSGRYARGGRM